MDLRILKVREQVVDTIRGFFKGQGFWEMFTPIMVPIPSAEANLEVFETELRTAGGQKRRGFLIMSPEYALKKLIAAGAGKVFEITHCFRNEEEVSRLHNPEFTMLEWYRTGADYGRIMEDFEELFEQIVKQTQPEADISRWEYQEERYNLKRPWMKMPVAEAFEKFSQINKETLLAEGQLKKAAEKKGYRIAKDTTWEQAFYQILFNEIEPAIAGMHQPVFLYDYPLSQAALARKSRKDPRFAERWEVFLAGVELGNCFSELTDSQEQRERFERDLEERKKLKKTEYGIDEELVAAVGQMPETAGIAVGVDRLVMLAADVKSVTETMAFPADEMFKLKQK